jgi:ribonuclease D
MAGERQPYVLVQSEAALSEAARRWREAPVLGLDTEFVRTNTFFHRLGLIQVSDGRTSWLVDPLAVPGLAPLVEVFQAEGTVKVLHSASEDMEVFYRAFGVLPAPLFDTQIAAALAGAGAFLSYQKLVAAFLGVEISKDETRTDWIARPLSSAQLAYAAEDVAHLLPVYERLRQELSALGRLSWAFEDSAALLDTTRFDEDTDGAYLRIKGAGRLDRRQLAALRLLAAWREGEARRRDLPRNFVLKEDLMLGLATRRPQDARELQKVPSYDARQAAQDSATWLQLLGQAESLPESDLPPRIERPPFSPALRELENRLKEKVRKKATDLSLPPEVLAPRRMLDAVLRLTVGKPEPRLPRELQGWRREVIGEDLLREALGG